MAFQLFQHVPSAGNICLVDRTEFSPGPLPGSTWRFVSLPYPQASLFGWSAVPLGVLGLVHCAICSFFTDETKRRLGTSQLLIWLLLSCLLKLLTITRSMFLLFFSLILLHKGIGLYSFTFTLVNCSGNVSEENFVHRKNDCIPSQIFFLNVKNINFSNRRASEVKLSPIKAFFSRRSRSRNSFK